MNDPIPVFRPAVGEEEYEAVRDVIESRWIGLGPKTAEFEREFSKYVGAEHASATNSGSAALHLALLALGVGPGAEVIVPSLTFVSSAQAAVWCGARPVFVEVYPDTVTMDVDDMRRKMTKKTKAIMPVHYGGHPCEMDEIMEIAKKKGIPVVEDAAHACGAEYRSRKIGSIGDLTCFSFHAVKNLTTGDGGMITTNDTEVAERIKALRWLGISKGTWDRYSRRGTSQTGRPSWYYEVSALGYKYHMNDMQAAIGLVQLRKLDSGNQRRIGTAKLYGEMLSKLGWVETPTEREYVKSVYHLYVIKVPRRDKLIGFLGDNGITASVHYMPVHRHPFFRSFPAKVPVTDRLWKRLLTLPMYPELSGTEVQRIADVIRRFDPR